MLVFHNKRGSRFPRIQCDACGELISATGAEVNVLLEATDNADITLTHHAHRDGACTTQIVRQLGSRYAGIWTADRYLASLRAIYCVDEEGLAEQAEGSGVPPLGL